MTSERLVPRTAAAAAPGAPSARTVLLALLMVGSIVAGVVVCLALDNPSGVVLYLAYGATGAYLVIRRPANSVGWLLLLTAVGAGLGSAPADAAWASVSKGDLDAKTATALWANACAFSVFFVGLLGLALVFPEGKLPGGRARGPSWILFVCAMLIAALISVNPSITDIFGRETANPVAFVPEAGVWSIVPDSNTLYWLLLVAFIVGIVALFVRSHRATGLARLQYRWLVAAVVLVAATTAVWATATIVFEQGPTGPAYVFALLAYPSVPIAIAVAVLRYRLFEIDRIISRTLAYAVVTATSPSFSCPSSSDSRPYSSSSSAATPSRSPPRP